MAGVVTSIRHGRGPVGKRVADELLLVMAVAPVFLGCRTLTAPLVSHELIQTAEINQALDVVG